MTNKFQENFPLDCLGYIKRSCPEYFKQKNEAVFVLAAYKTAVTIFLQYFYNWTTMKTIINLLKNDVSKSS